MRAATAKNVVADLGNVVGNSDLSSEYLRMALTDTDNGNVVSAVYSGGNMKAATAQKAVGDLGNVLAPSDLRQEYFQRALTDTKNLVSVVYGAGKVVAPWPRRPRGRGFASSLRQAQGGAPLSWWLPGSARISGPG